jgi:hypothetical protein
MRSSFPVWATPEIAPSARHSENRGGRCPPADHSPRAHGGQSALPKPKKNNADLLFTNVVGAVRKLLNG